jgi:acyl-coenzyme A thioesterase PaaI-like protein
MTVTAPKHYWDIPPALPTGAWAEKRRLAASLRELIAIVVATDAPEQELAHATHAANEIVHALAGHPRRTFKQAYKSLRGPEEFAVFADRTAITGLSNPLSPPMTLGREGDAAFGLVTFGTPYEGVPGCVHGGFVAAAFDQVFGYLQVVRGAGGLTATLEIRYRRPTPMDTELRIVARTSHVDGRKSVVTATMTAGDVVTAEASATFIEIDAARMNAIVSDADPTAPKEG